jgi:hypothetical protein
MGNRIKVTPDNYKLFTKGTVSNAFSEEGKAKALITFYDPMLIDDIKAGRKDEVSIGFDHIEDGIPGMFDGQRYYTAQRQITVNHLAVVAHARAGDDTKLNLYGDSMDTNQAGKANQAVAGSVQPFIYRSVDGKKMFVVDSKDVQEKLLTLNKQLRATESELLKMAKPFTGDAHVPGNVPAPAPENANGEGQQPEPPTAEPTGPGKPKVDAVKPGAAADPIDAMTQQIAGITPSLPDPEGEEAKKALLDEIAQLKNMVEEFKAKADTFMEMYKAKDAEGDAKAKEETEAKMDAAENLKAVDCNAKVDGLSSVELKKLFITKLTGGQIKTDSMGEIELAARYDACKEIAKIKANKYLPGTQVQMAVDGSQIAEKQKAMTYAYELNQKEKKR